MARPCSAVAAAVLTLALIPVGSWAEDVVVAESSDDSRVYSVRCRLKVEGEIQTATTTTPAPTAEKLKLDVDGKLSFTERRLPRGGQGPLALRSLRFYEVAEADIDVAGRRSTKRLAEGLRTIVAEGQVDGVRCWSTGGRMTNDAVDLLQTPGDNLALLGLLPTSTVESGSEWQPDKWVLPLLTGVEAVSKTQFKCRVESIDENFVIIRFDGQIEGAILGALTKIALNGQLAWDRKKGHIRQAKVTQVEERAVGAVSPGMKVTATMYVDRQVSSVSGPLTRETIEAIPINAEPKHLALTFDSPWNLQFAFGRNWHIFHQTQDVAVLRLMEAGSLVAQCNVSKVPSAAPGQHTPEQQFVADIQTALGSQLQKIVSADPVESEDGYWAYRVVAAGQARNLPMTWYYYLCAAPDGRQAAFVFSVESRLVEKLAGRDQQIVSGLRFLKVPTQQARADK
jgi:hypothetical protein